MAILFLDRRGCEFDGMESASTKLSDIGNFRVTTNGYTIPSKDGRMFFIEFSGGHPNYIYRKVNKRNGMPLKNPVRELDMMNRLYADFQFENEQGCWGDCKLFKDVFDARIEYTIEGLLSVVNMVSSEHYDCIEWI